MIAEAKVYQIINEPLTDEEAFEEMGDQTEKKDYKSEFCMGISHASCGDMSCSCVCHETNWPPLGL